jgi:hypothetical protein
MITTKQGEENHNGVALIKLPPPSLTISTLAYRIAFDIVERNRD